MHGKVMTIAAASLWIVGSAGVAVAAPGAADWRQQGMRATRALNLLEEHGVAARGEDFNADVIKRGQVVHVTIDRRSGQISNAAGAEV